LGRGFSALGSTFLTPLRIQLILRGFLVYTLSIPADVLPIKKEGWIMVELKSAWELAMEKAKKMGEDDLPSLSPDEKKEIAEVRKVYEAKFAEVEILVQDKEKKDLELDRLRRERDRKIETVYERAKKKH
jgi:hypothetical protein